MFYKGLKPSTRTIVDVSAGGTLNRLSHDEAYDLLDVLAYIDSQWISKEESKEDHGIDAFATLQEQLALMSKRLDDLSSSY